MSFEFPADYELMLPLESTSVARLNAGAGRISLSLHGDKAVFSELAATYPLKLLSAQIHDATALLYLLTYGGGLVGGDVIDLTVTVRCGARLVLLSQGTTKVFRTRPSFRLASVSPAFALPPNSTLEANPSRSSLTRQRLQFAIESGSTLLLLPEPVTCFRDASYNQIQRFDIQKDGSVVILDWITSGRISMGEEWAFLRYYSLNEVWYDGKKVAKDVMLLENQHDTPGDHDNSEPQVPARPLRDRLAPYSCYAMVILYGPQVHMTISSIHSRYEQLSVFKLRSPPPLIWSFSALESTKQGAVIRVAAVETETVKLWLKDALSSLEDIIGIDAYRRVL